MSASAASDSASHGVLSTCKPQATSPPLRMLYRKMGEAGVTLVYPENLTIIDKEARTWVHHHIALEAYCLEDPSCKSH